MDTFFDFSKYKEYLGADYGGSDRKIGILIYGERWMVKFAEKHEHKEQTEKQNSTSSLNNCVTEYIGSHIASSLGIDTHETRLGTYNGEFVVACKDFREKNDITREFAVLLRANYDSKDIGKIPKIEQIYNVMQVDPSLEGLREGAIQRYWDTFVVDALVGNFDRHKGNWGYIYNENTQQTRLAPAYDFGSSLYPRASEEFMDQLLNGKKEAMRRIFQFPNAALLVNGTKVSYYDMLSSGVNKDCDDALKRIFPRIDMDEVRLIIDNTPEISQQQRIFYKYMLRMRFENILVKAYDLRQENKIDIEARNRIETGTPYDSARFEKDWDDGIYGEEESIVKNERGHEYDI